MSAQNKKLLPWEILPLIAVSLIFSVPAFGAENNDPKPLSSAKQHSVTVATKPKLPKDRQAAKPNNVTVAHKASGSDKKPTSHTGQAAVSAGHAASYDSQGRVIRRVAVATKGGPQGFDHTLLDDGTFWREDGSRTTWQQTGMASWYGGARWQGKRTSSGDRFDQNQLTAAHATLPIGTKVRVIRTDGRGSVVVTINDRPGTRTRVIDLSRAAAKELGILTAGVTMVTLQPL